MPTSDLEQIRTIWQPNIDVKVSIQLPGERKKIMHYCIHLLTKNLPTEKEIEKIMEPCRGEQEDET